MFVFVCYALLCGHSSFAIILKRKRKLVVVLLLSYRCIVTVNVLWLFLTMPWIGLQCVIVVTNILSLKTNCKCPSPRFVEKLCLTHMK